MSSNPKATITIVALSILGLLVGAWMLLCGNCHLASHHSTPVEFARASTAANATSPDKEDASSTRADAEEPVRAGAPDALSVEPEGRLDQPADGEKSSGTMQEPAEGDPVFFRDQVKP